MVIFKGNKIDNQLYSVSSSTEYSASGASF